MSTDNTDWRCPRSPEGIHYSMVTRDSTMQTCKYCGKVKILREKPKTPVVKGLTDWELTQVVR